MSLICFSKSTPDKPRWVQVDVSAGQDFFGSLRATTVSLAVNVGWSRAL